MFPAALGIVVQTFPLRRRGKALFFGFHQSPIWGWGNPAIAACIAAGLVPLVTLYAVEGRTASPLTGLWA